MGNSTQASMVRTTYLEVPAEREYARVVRLTAANLASLANFGLADVDDIRMAAEEAFVYSLATNPGDTLKVAFHIAPNEVAMDFDLGRDWEADNPDEPSLAYSALILEAMCDVFEVFDAPDAKLHLEKRADA